MARRWELWAADLVARVGGGLQLYFFCGVFVTADGRIPDMVCEYGGVG